VYLLLYGFIFDLNYFFEFGFVGKVLSVVGLVEREVRIV
jgi:hypothetical protein